MRNSSSSNSRRVRSSARSPRRALRARGSRRRSPVSSASPSPAGRRRSSACSARDDLLHGEGLDDVVVGPGLQPADAVVDLVARREHADRHLVAALAQAAQDLEAVEVGHAQVEQDDRRMHALGRLQRRAAARGGHDRRSPRARGRRRRCDGWRRDRRRAGRPARRGRHPRWTTSQSPATSSCGSAMTRSRPGPQVTWSTTPSRARTRSLPRPAAMVSDARAAADAVVARAAQQRVVARAADDHVAAGVAEDRVVAAPAVEVVVAGPAA